MRWLENSRGPIQKDSLCKELKMGLTEPMDNIQNLSIFLSINFRSLHRYKYIDRIKSIPIAGIANPSMEFFLKEKNMPDEYIGQIAVLMDGTIHPASIGWELPEDIRDLTKYRWEWLDGMCNTDYYIVYRKP